MESIYKNNSQSSKASTGTTSEATAYLKKSELPKNVSAFKNDAGYISSTALDEWLRTHSYISKDEIQELISNANLVVIDSIDESSDAEAIRRLEESVTSLRSEIVAIKDTLIATGISKGFITADKESSFATETEISGIRSDVTNIQTAISQIEEENQNFLTEHQSLDAYAKKTYVQTEISNAMDENLEDYVRLGYTYSKDHIDTAISVFLRKDIAKNTYETIENVSSKYLTKKDASNTYLMIEDYTGIKDASTINSDYTDKTLDDITEDIDTLMNGFYLFNQQIDPVTGNPVGDIVIIKDHTIVSFFKDGVQHGVDGQTPYIGDNNNWWIGTEDTGVKAKGTDGQTPYIGEDNYWYIGGTKTSTKATGNDGEDGKSAYEIAKETDPTIGTKDEWVESLGGIPGKSAYAIAVDEGFTGNETEWLESLNGQDGTNGENGKSAYDIAIDNGFTGNESEWLESLKGHYTWKII